MCINNCVVTAFLGCRLDLPTLAWRCHGEFDPVKFAAAKLRISDPPTTALIFASGKVVCTGAASERAAFAAVLKYARLIRRNVPGKSRVRCLDVRFQNMVSSARFGKNINLSSLFEALKKETTIVRWNPQIFPGLHFLPASIDSTLPPKNFVIVFSSGKVVITGAKSRDEIARTWRFTHGRIASHATDEELFHSKVVTAKRLEEITEEESEIENFDLDDF